MWQWIVTERPPQEHYPFRSSLSAPNIVPNRVTLSDQSVYEATVVGADPNKDVAVLHIDAPPEKLRPLPVGSSSDLLVGQKVFAIGNPFGLDHTLTTGVISGLQREITSVTRRPIQDVIQTDAAINPGNSGGPLLDSSGTLIGINTAIYSPSGASSGVGFAIPVDTVSGIVEQIIEYGQVTRPALNLAFAPEQLVDQLGISGVLVLEVNPNGAAAKAGLRPTSRDSFGRLMLGDIITAIDGKPIYSGSDLYKILDKCQVGQTVDVQLLRGNEEVVVPITLDGLSGVLYVFCMEEPTWLAACFREYKGEVLRFDRSWRQTVLNKLSEEKGVERRDLKEPLHFKDFQSMFLYRRWYRCHVKLEAFEGDTGHWWLEVYPLLRPEDKPMEVMQRPGETIYVPSGWWHSVLNLDLTVAVTQNFASSANFDCVCLDMVPGRHRGVARAGRLAIEAGEKWDERLKAMYGEGEEEEDEDEWEEVEEGEEVEGSEEGEEEGGEGESEGEEGEGGTWNGMQGRLSALAAQQFLSEGGNEGWSMPEIRILLRSLWPAQPQLQERIWKNACLCMDAATWHRRVVTVCQAHGLPAPKGLDALPLGSGSNAVSPPTPPLSRLLPSHSPLSPFPLSLVLARPLSHSSHHLPPAPPSVQVYMVGQHVVKLYLPMGSHDESAATFLAKELAFYRELHACQSPLLPCIPPLVASGLLFSSGVVDSSEEEETATGRGGRDGAGAKNDVQANGVESNGRSAEAEGGEAGAEGAEGEKQQEGYPFEVSVAPQEEQLVAAEWDGLTEHRPVNPFEDTQGAVARGRVGKKGKSGKGKEEGRDRRTPAYRRRAKKKAEERRRRRELAKGKKGKDGGVGVGKGEKGEAEQGEGEEYDEDEEEEEGEEEEGVWPYIITGRCPGWQLDAVADLATPADRQALADFFAACLSHLHSLPLPASPLSPPPRKAKRKSKEEKTGAQGAAGEAVQANGTAKEGVGNGAVESGGKEEEQEEEVVVSEEWRPFAEMMREHSKYIKERLEDIALHASHPPLSLAAPLSHHRGSLPPHLVKQAVAYLPKDPALLFQGLVSPLPLLPHPLPPSLCYIMSDNVLLAAASPAATPVIEEFVARGKDSAGKSNGEKPGAGEGGGEKEVAEEGERVLQPSSIIDFGTLILGDPLYDLVMVHVSAQRCNKADLARLLATYKPPRPNDVLSRVFRYRKELSDVKTLEEIATAVWGQLDELV
ncbi:unnamed protein product [Closterium sp. Naga37s-1]|nr:unnamed protein product [Closterium sp. Naga37s-1]